MRSKRLLALTIQFSQAYAGISTKCVASDVCFSLNIPSSTLASGTGDIFVQISGSTSYSWLSVGQGSEMRGANYFIVYTDSSGSNVTLSSRLAGGHDEPTYNSAAQMSLEPGSGVSNGIMTANIKCSNCNSWSGGSMDLTSSSSTWIWAYKSGSPLNSDSKSASIAEHDNYGTLSFDANAQGGGDANPFVDPNGTSNSAASACISASPGSSPSSSTVSSERGNGGNDGGESGDGDSDDDAGGETTEAQSQHSSNTYPARVKRSSNEFAAQELVRRAVPVVCDSTAAGVQVSGGSTGRLVTIHGVLAGGVLCVVFPIGGIIIRLLSFKGLLWTHGILQVGGYIAYIVAVGIGVKLALDDDLLTNGHSIIGLVILVVLLFQAPFGWIHHVAFKRTKGRTAWSYLHIWIGRTVIPIGVINAVLGAELADASTLKSVAIGVGGGIVWIIYIISSFIGERRRSRKMALATDSVERTHDRIPLREQVGEIKKNNHRTHWPET